jgi:REP-associated tyrosine transposase
LNLSIYALYWLYNYYLFRKYEVETEMRLPRPVIKNCCVHITHRCQERKYLLCRDIDRKYYQLLLYQASEKFRRVRFLNYVITSNHVHLLAFRNAG